MKYEVIIFDVDGTMLDTSEGLRSATIYMIQEMGLAMPESSVLDSFIGPRIQDSLSRVYGLSGKARDKAAAVFRDRYRQGDVLKAKPYAGMCELINKLADSGRKMAVATNKRQDFTDDLMKKFGFDQSIRCVRGTDLSGELKKEDLVRQCLEYYAVSNPKNAVMVGDSSYDAKAAAEVGVDFIGVTYGFEFRSKEDVRQYAYVGCAKDVEELAGLLGDDDFRVK